MIFGQDRRELRQMYAEAWRKTRGGELLSPLEAQIAQVIEDHPEYQSCLTAEGLEESFTPEGRKTNPFLHMGLHLAVREQVATNRPAGISDIFQQLVSKISDIHEVEHRMLDCLAESLWEAQNQNSPPDEQQYLERLRKLTRQAVISSGDSRSI
ncbi:MAG: DUF1841 family protein [Woeseia sp.]